MIQFNELRITQDGKNLIIDAQVQDISYYTDVYIDSIIIDSQNTVVSSGASSSPLFKYTYDATTASTLGYVTSLTFGGKLKGIRMTIPYNSLGETSNLDKDLLFVYVTINGTHSSDTPCNMDLTYELGIVYNTYPFYLRGMNFIKELNSSCELPKQLVDYMLRQKVLETCIQVGDYTKAGEYWKKFFTGDYQVINLKTCSCNG